MHWAHWQGVVPPSCHRRGYTLCHVTAIASQHDMHSSQADFDYAVVKQTNSLLDCGGKQRRRILDMVANATVLLCGVTTTSCVKAAVEALTHRCKRVVVAADAVAVRKVASLRGDKLVQGWGADTLPTAAVSSVASWRDLLPPRVHVSAEALRGGTTQVAASGGAEACDTPAVPAALLPYVLGEAAPRLMYIVNGSIPSWRVLIALHHGGVDCQTTRMFVMSRPRPTRLPGFLAMNPRGQTPVLLEGAAVLRHGSHPGRLARHAQDTSGEAQDATQRALEEATERMERVHGAGVAIRESLAILTYLQRHVAGMEWLLPSEVRSWPVCQLAHAAWRR